jgi:ribosome maturation factor RimP
MEWKEWIGRKVFLRTKYNKVYSGKVVNVDDSDSQIIWFTILDKFGNLVTIVHSEIVELKEESQ